MMPPSSPRPEMSRNADSAGPQVARLPRLNRRVQISACDEALGGG